MAKLSERAILVYCRVSRWTGQHQNKSVSKELCRSKGADDDAATVVINAIPRESLATLHSKANKVHGVWVRFARPWLDGGIRILPLSKLAQYEEEMNKAIAEYDAEAKRWVTQEYPKLLENMPKRLADLLDGRQMPSERQLMGRLTIKTGKLPIPSADDLNTDDADLRAGVASSIDDLSRTAMADVWRQFSSLVSKVQEKLSEPDKKFKNSLIENLRSFCESLPSENFTDDRQLEALRQKVLTEFAQIDADDLRDNPAFRKGIAKTSASLLGEIDGIRKMSNDL